MQRKRILALFSVMAFLVSVNAPANNGSLRGTQEETALDQGNQSAELNVTQAIRKNLMADKTLSVRAKNITVITKNQRVTLQGEVNSENESRKVETLAKKGAGPSMTVINKLKLSKNI